MATVLPGYLAVVSDLEALLEDLPGKLVGLDGRDGVGKTTFGRYLAWRFNVSLIESDLFLKRGSSEPEYRLREINRIIQFRLEKPRPVILEGIALQRLLEQLGRPADYVFYCYSELYNTGSSLGSWLDEYDSKYRPRECASAIADLTYTDG